MGPMRSPLLSYCCTAFAAAGRQAREANGTLLFRACVCHATRGPGLTTACGSSRPWPCPWLWPAGLSLEMAQAQGLSPLHAILLFALVGCCTALLAITHTGYVLLSSFMPILHLTLF
jgi:hypothetical protein